MPPQCSGCNPDFLLRYQNVFNTGLVLELRLQCLRRMSGHLKIPHSGEDSLTMHLSEAATP